MHGLNPHQMLVAAHLARPNIADVADQRGPADRAREARPEPSHRLTARHATLDRCYDPIPQVRLERLLCMPASPTTGTVSQTRCRRKPSSILPIRRYEISFIIELRFPHVPAILLS